MKTLLAALAIVSGTAAAAQNAGTASAARGAVQQTRDAIRNIERLNPQVNAVLAVDPTALDQARALDRGSHARRSFRDADPDQG